MLSYFHLSSVVLLLVAIIGNNNYVNAAELDLDSIAPPLSMCVIESSDGPVPEDLWATTEIIVDSKKYPPYEKYIETRGIVLAAINDGAVSDEFLTKVATTLNDMIPDDEKNDDLDREQQETMIATLARKRTFIPIVPRAGFDPLSEAEFELVEEIRGTHSSCDMIFELGMENPRQPMEVAKILLLHLNLIGLHYLLPEEWGMTTRSQLFEELEISVSEEKQYLNVAFYEAMVPPDAPEEVMDDILLKQYSFWLLATWMDIVEDYGPNDVGNEWQLYTPALLEEKQPSAWDLCDDYLTSLLASPTNLAEYGPTNEEVQAAEEALQQAIEEAAEAAAAAAAAAEAALLADPLRPLGNCVSTTDDGPVPDDLWSTTDIIVNATKYPPFQKYIETRGMIFAAISDETISDDFLTKMATTVNQLIPDDEESDTYNRTKQEDMITILAQKRTLIPIVLIGTIFDDLSEEESVELDTIQDEYSSCDVIIQLAAGDPNQPMEVVKHVLHHLNMIGLNYLMYDQWGMRTQKSELFTNLVDASKNAYFNIQSYKDELGNNNAELDLILLQQYSYWLISTWMNIVEDYGPPLKVVKEEWQLYAPDLLEDKQPQAYALGANTLTDLLATPTNLADYDTRTAAEKEEDEKEKEAAVAEKDEKDEPDKKDDLAVEIVEVKGEPDKKEEFETEIEMEKEDKDGSGDPSDEEEEEEEGDVDEEEEEDDVDEETSEVDGEGPVATSPGSSSSTTTMSLASDEEDEDESSSSMTTISTASDEEDEDESSSSMTTISTASDEDEDDENEDEKDDKNSDDEDDNEDEDNESGSKSEKSKSEKSESESESASRD